MQEPAMAPKRHVPKTDNGKKLLYIVEKIPEDMETILFKNVNWLGQITTNVSKFGDKLVENRQLHMFTKMRILNEKFVDIHQTREIYTHVGKRGNWEGLIHAWEGSNDHIIEELLNRFLRTSQWVKESNADSGQSRVICLEDACDSYNEGEDTIINSLEAEMPLEACENFRESQNISESTTCVFGLRTPNQISNIPTNALTRLIAVHWRLIIMSMTILGLCMILVFYTVTKLHTYWIPIQSPNETTSVLRKDTPSVHLSKQLIFEITSSRDLENLGGVESVVISNLEISAPSPRYLHSKIRLNYPTVKNLTVSGSVSARWLEYIIGSFGNLQHLSINMTSICFSNTLESNTLEYPSLTLIKCETFQVLNSKTCYLESWIYRWQFPHLKNVIFKNVQINRRNCKKVNRLLNKNGGSNVNVIFDDCNIYDCNLDNHRKDVKYDSTIAKTIISKSFRAT